MRFLVLSLLVAFALPACGGAQAPPPEPVAAPAPPPPPPAPTEPDRSHLLWYVYWDGIHVLTIYPYPGPIRSEEPQNQGPPYGTDSAYFSIISHYYEQEDLWRLALENASSLDDLVVRLERVDLVEVEEALNPVQGEAF